MSNYRRLISYIYAYEGGIKGKNVGFAKLEVRNGQCKIQVNVRNVYIGNQDTGVYLLSGSKEILVGRIFIRNGAGEFRAVVSVGNVAGSGHAIDQCYGLTVHNLSDSWQCYTTIWEDAVAHAAEVALEEATSDRVKKEEEPVKGSVAKAVEVEIEAQNRKEELSSVVLPVEPEGGEILHPADLSVMEIRPMEVLPIGKESTAADLNRESEKESSGNIQEGQEDLGDVQNESDTAWESSGSRQEETEGFEESVQEEENLEQEVSKPAGTEAELTQVVPKQGEQESEGLAPEDNPDLEEKLSGTEVPVPESLQQPETQSHRQPMQHMQDNSEPQPFRSNAWGQGGMLFPPNWFARPARQSRPAQQSAQSASGRQTREARAEQPGNQKLESGSNARPQQELQNSQAAAGGKINAGNVLPEQSIPEEGPPIDSVWQRFYKTYPKIQAFDYNGGCEILTIKPQDIGLLPRETWGYGNNSFLLHGYYNHRYLIFARLNNPNGRPRFLLGVPGHYYSNEKYMAAMFGFPNFVLSKVQPTGDDRFGYWYTDVRLGS